MSRDDFDLDDFGDFEEPSFPEEEEFLPPEQVPPERPQRNTAFLIIAVLLVLVFLIGLGVTAKVIIDNNEDQLHRQQTIDAVFQTNTAVGIALFGTQTAKAWTPTPSPTATFTDTP